MPESAILGALAKHALRKHIVTPHHIQQTRTLACEARPDANVFTNVVQRKSTERACRRRTAQFQAVRRPVFKAADIGKEQLHKERRRDKITPPYTAVRKMAFGITRAASASLPKAWSPHRNRGTRNRQCRTGNNRDQVRVLADKRLK